MHPYLQLTRLDKPVGSLLLLWPTLAALFIAAEGLPPIGLLFIFAAGTFLMRSAGCVINDYADRHVDGAVERTRDRPLPAGTVRPKEALILFAGLCLAAGVLVLFLNRQTQLLALGGLLCAALYPFMKRWTYLPQVVLGAAFSWGILMAFTAAGAGLTNAAGVMFVGSLLWIVAYDTMYAMVDREDDLKVGIKSTAILFGQLDRLMIGILQLSALLAFLLMAGQLQYQHGFYLGWMVCAGLFVYQQYLIRKRERPACLAAFKNNIWVGFALFCGVLLELSVNYTIAA
ncbi:MAG: 4-hydroxybenzoate octaprenyltransferase [Pseudomonadota bacterium]